MKSLRSASIPGTALEVVGSSPTRPAEFNPPYRGGAGARVKVRRVDTAERVLATHEVKGPERQLGAGVDTAALLTVAQMDSEARFDSRPPQ